MTDRPRATAAESAPSDTSSPGFFGSRLSVRLLCLLMLFYIPVQWIAGRRPGSTSIFSRDHRNVERQVLAMILALRQQLPSQCTQHGVHHIFFPGDDVISAYVVNQVEATPGCEMQRETPVTLNAPALELSCSAEVVDEKKPDAWTRGRQQHDLGPLTGKMAPVSRWESDGGEYGFTLLQAKNCVHMETQGDAR